MVYIYVYGESATPDEGVREVGAWGTERVRVMGANWQRMACMFTWYIYCMYGIYGVYTIHGIHLVYYSVYTPYICYICYICHVCYICYICYIYVSSKFYLRRGRARGGSMGHGARARKPAPLWLSPNWQRMVYMVYMLYMVYKVYVVYIWYIW